MKSEAGVDDDATATRTRSTTTAARNSLRAATRGFSLVEMVVTVTLMGLAMVPIMMAGTRRS